MYVRIVFTTVLIVEYEMQSNKSRKEGEHILSAGSKRVDLISDDYSTDDQFYIILLACYVMLQGMYIIHIL